MRTIVISNVQRPLPEIERALRKEYPRSGILGVGIGRRRHERDEGAPIGEEVAVKILLRRKKRPLPKGKKRLPRSLVLDFRYFGQPVRVRVPVDVEQAELAIPTKYEVGPLGQGSLCLSCYARWDEGGVARIGALTAGHGLWPNPTADKPRATVPVQLGAACPEPTIEVRVRYASHFVRDKRDVALLEFDAASTPSLLHPCMTRIFKDEPEEPDDARLMLELGQQGDGRELTASFRHYDLSPQDFQAVAYYEKRFVDIHGWGGVWMEHVVESQGESDTFVGGTSGSGLVSKSPLRFALGIQSLCTDPGPLHQDKNRRSIATSLHEARSWIKKETGLSVDLFWKIE